MVVQCATVKCIRTRNAIIYVVGLNWDPVEVFRGNRCSLNIVETHTVLLLFTD